MVNTHNTVIIADKDTVSSHGLWFHFMILTPVLLRERNIIVT